MSKPRGQRLSRRFLRIHGYQLPATRAIVLWRQREGNLMKSFAFLLALSLAWICPALAASNQDEIIVLSTFKKAAGFKGAASACSNPSLKMDAQRILDATGQTAAKNRLFDLAEYEHLSKLNQKAEQEAKSHFEANSFECKGLEAEFLAFKGELGLDIKSEWDIVGRAKDTVLRLVSKERTRLRRLAYLSACQSKGLPYSQDNWNQIFEEVKSTAMNIAALKSIADGDGIAVDENRKIGEMLTSIHFMTEFYIHGAADTLIDSTAPENIINKEHCEQLIRR